MAFTPTEIAAIVSANAAARVRQEKQERYYKGRHDILTQQNKRAIEGWMKAIAEGREREFSAQRSVGMGQSDRNKDGTLRVKKVHNLIRRCVNRHVGFAFGQPVQIVSKKTDAEQSEDRGTAPKTGGTLKRVARKAMAIVGLAAPADANDATPENDGLKAYEEIRDWNDLNAIDTSHYKDGLIEDVSYEVFSFDKRFDDETQRTDLKIEITKMPRGQCIGVFDSDGELVALIRRVKIKAGTIWRGTLETLDRTECWVYEKDQIAVYNESTSTAEGTGDTGYSYALAPDTKEFPNPEQNPLGHVLAVAFRLDPECDPFISDTAIALQDHFNDILSGEGNAVVEDTKDNWKVKGFTNTEDNRDAFLKMLSDNILFLPNGADADRIETGASVEMIKHNQEWTRQALFETLGAADTEKIIASTGQASGLALKLAHAPMMETAAPMIDNFQRGIRRRVDLINLIHAKLGRPTIENYTIRMKTQVLINESELWEKLPILREGLALEDALSLAVPSIDDPKAAAKRFEEEKDRQLERDIMLRDAPAPVGAPVPAQAASRIQQRAQIEANATPDLSATTKNLKSGITGKDAQALVDEARKLGVGSAS